MGRKKASKTVGIYYLAKLLIKSLDAVRPARRRQAQTLAGGGASAVCNQAGLVVLRESNRAKQR